MIQEQLFAATSFQEFSRKLIQTKDLDPDYVFMNHFFKVNPELGLDYRIEWIINKVFIYDTASELRFMSGQITLEEIEYGAERRKNKQNTAKQLDAFLSGFKLSDLPNEYTAAREYLTSFTGIGDWAAWKFCDLIERVAGLPMDFSNVDFRKAYSFPLKGLCRVNGEPDEFVSKLSDHMTYFAFMKATELQLGDVLELASPPTFNRKINIQEIETCLCKYHSHLSGHYHIGKDTKHLLERLTKYGLEPKENLF